VIIHFYFSKKENNQEKYDFFNRKRKEDNINMKNTRDFDLELNDNDFGDITETKL
jgi:hypothetical protein